LEDSVDLDATLHRLVTWYENSADATYEARKKAERDRDYVDNKQWTSEEEDTLKKRKQPVITINRIKPKVDALRGLERQMRTDPKAYPRNPGDEQGAAAATDAIRYVCDCNNFSRIRSQVLEYLAVEGCAGGVVEFEKGKIKVRLIAWDRLYYDPHSREPDFSDARYTGIVVWMDEDQAVARWGDKAKELFSYGYDKAKDSTYSDKPFAQWFDCDRKRGRVCEVYYKQGDQWMHCYYTQGGFLEEPKPSAYVDEEGRPINAMVLASCHIDRDNNRYGVVRQLIGPQDEINKRRSKALHLLTMRQVQIVRGVTDDINQVRKELAKPDGVIEVNTKDDLVVLPTGDMAQGHLALLQEAKAEIDSVGANAAVSGKDETAVSGRALQARQQAGVAELGGLFDSLRMWSHEIYKHIWYGVKQFWTEETWVRVTDDERNIKFVGLNHQMTYGELLKQMIQRNADPMKVQKLQQMLQANPQAENMPSGVVDNNTATMDMDIVIEDAPDVASIQSEQYEILADLYGKQIQAGQQGPLTIEDVIEASQVRNKDQILERAKQRQQPDPQQQQIQQMGIQLEMQDKQAGIRVKNAQAAKYESEVAQPEAPEQPGELDMLERASMIQKNHASAAQAMASADKTRMETSLMPAKAAHEAHQANAKFALDVQKQNDTVELGRLKPQE
jgi:hypothetical protein